MNIEYRGTSGGVPHHPRRGQQWFECYICGFDFPIEEARIHYLSKRKVDKNCDDQKNHTDYMAEIIAPRERVRDLDQPVRCQGEVTGTRWYEGRFYEGKWYDPGDEDCSGQALDSEVLP